ncbi:hypothetical protein N008_20810 [Hymenobacter sp. APR13]|nr:hypothetical protein N008_20810 [Hymenobacter sp. APR13]
MRRAVAEGGVAAVEVEARIEAMGYFQAGYFERGENGAEPAGAAEKEQVFQFKNGFKEQR